MKEMKIFRIEKTIDAPVESVFQYLNKDEHVLQWHSFLQENHYHDGKEESLTTGSKFISIWKIGKKTYTFHVEVEMSDPPYSMLMKTMTKEGRSVTQYWLSPEDFGEDTFGTKIVIESRLLPKNFLYAWKIRLTGWLSRFVYHEQYDRFIEYVYEQEADEMVIDLPDEEGTTAMAYRNEQRSWDVYFDEFDPVADQGCLQRLISRGYTVDEERGIYLFTVGTSREAEQRLEVWMREVWLPMSQ